MYENLLGNLPPQYFNQKELLIVTDKNLALLPFEALVIPHQNKDTTFDKMAYALHRYTFTYTSSFKIYQNNARISIPIQPKVAAFTYNESSFELPYSSKEINVLKAIYGANLTSFIGNQCTKQHFLPTKIRLIYCTLPYTHRVTRTVEKTIKSIFHPNKKKP
ncbi:MAG: CHAT domain-containing protein [Saprospiraceae bacterium]|nr:CHAT domain-containing protein [Saprospiraceae bacterium]